MCTITEPQSVGSLRGVRVRQSGGCWKAVGGSRKLGGLMHPVSTLTPECHSMTGFPLCLSQLYTTVGASAAGLSVRSSGARYRKMYVSDNVAEQCYGYC